MALNQTQRKYAIERLTVMHNIKAKAITEAFDTLLINRFKPIQSERKPASVEVLKAIAGLPSTAVLKDNYLELISQHDASASQFGSIALTWFAKSTNIAEISEINTYNDAIYARRQIEVVNRHVALKAELTRCTDALFLGDEAEALETISAFHTFVV